MTKQNKYEWLALNDKVCVVTGAAGGIGSAIAKVLGESGARLAFLDPEAGKCENLAQTLGANGIEAFSFACDIGDARSVEAAAASVEAKLGAADVLVNNAGLLRPGGIEDIALDADGSLFAYTRTISAGMICASQAGQAAMKTGVQSWSRIRMIRADHTCRTMVLRVATSCP